MEMSLTEAYGEAWHRARLFFLLHSGQVLINNACDASTGQLFVCNISRQWGKSYWAAWKAIKQANSKENQRIKYGTAFQTDLIEFILPTFETLLMTCPEHLKPTYIKHGSKWVFPNGSEIKLVGLDKTPNSLRGNVIDLIIIDEAGFVDNLEYIYKSIIVPATLHRPNCKIIFISTPPSTPAHAFVDFIQKAELEKSYVCLTIYDNPRITQRDIDRMAEELGGITSTTFRRECLCELVTDKDLSIIPEWKDDLVQPAPRDQYYELYHKYVGMDLGVKDLTACIFGYYDFKRATVVIEDEFHTSGETGINTELLVGMIRAKETALWGEMKPYRRIADNNNLMLIADLSYLHNLTFIPTTKESLEAMINELRILVQNGRVIIDPKCTQLIGCLKFGVWDKHRKKFAQSKAYGHFDHLAALIYLVRNLAQHANPIPVVMNATHRTWTGSMDPNINQTPNQKTMSRALKPKFKADIG
jgi:hypothetical protein